MAGPQGTGAAARTLYIGVDEAGYGPLLGPLCIGAAAVRCAAPPAEAPYEVDLRAPLAGLVRPVPRGRDTQTEPLPVPIDDSKRIKQRYGLLGLARGVGAFAAAMGVAPPADLEDLLTRFSDRDPPDLARVPWLQDLGGTDVPRYPWFGVLDDAWAERGVTALDLRVLPMSAAELNVAFAESGNKAQVLGTLSASLVLSLLDRYPGEDAVVCMDRQGGRKHYAAYLATHFPLSSVQAEPAPPGESRYRVSLPGRTLRFRFLTGGDQRCLAVGWASMAAKLTRELCMAAFNRWFCDRAPALAPTAGYMTDGRRFLRDAAAVIAEESVPDALLIRSR